MSPELQKAPDESGKTAPKTEQEPSLDELWKKLNATKDGLSSDEAASRQEKYGPNELVEKRESLFIKFLSYFWGPIPWMIEAAIVLSAVVKHVPDLIVISILLLANAFVGFWEEYQAGNTIEALKKKLAPRAKVRRDGQWKTLNARELVPGDVVRLRIGDIVPADAKLMEGDTIQLDQSALTGESLPVEKGTDETAYSGTIVKKGEMDALVYATGGKTFFGRTASLVERKRSVSHFQKAILKVGDYLIFLALGLVIIILAVALFRGDPMLTTIQFMLVLTVAAIPVAMPTVLSVTMAVGARLLAAKQAIVSRLASIEEMAGVDVLCSDKTGTLTKNELTPGTPFTVGGVEAEAVVKAAGLASRKEDQDPIDLAVLGGLKEGWNEGYEIQHFQPFDPVSKRTEAQVKGPDGKTFYTSKGAPQVILELANDKSLSDKVNEAIQDFANKGFRSLGVARSEDHKAWQFLGVLPLSDPPRDDSKEMVAAAEDMGVQIKMVTGDQVAIAKEIARELDLGTNILDSSMLGEGKEELDDQQARQIENADGFAQVYPEHKYRIVEGLQKHGHIVGMTGDGVNDAPALKRADAGIAVSGATDAARSAAAIVLTTPGLSVVVDAIKESRKIFQRMESYATYRIAETVRVLLFMTLSILVFNFYPVTAIMIVLLALLNDGAIISIAFDRARYSKTPEAWDMHYVIGVATALGLMGVVETFGLFYIAEHVFKLNREVIQTFMYLKLSVAGHLTIFVTRTRGPFWAFRPSKILTIAVFGTQGVATLIAVFGLLMTPIGWKWAAVIWVYALSWVFIEDRTKLLTEHIIDKDRPGILSFARRAPRRRQSGTGVLGSGEPWKSVGGGESGGAKGGKGWTSEAKSNEPEEGSGVGWAAPDRRAGARAEPWGPGGGSGGGRGSDGGGAAGEKDHAGGSGGGSPDGSKDGDKA
jgi:H+-transporting ATPase